MGIEERSVERRADVIVRDVSYPSAARGSVDAWLVEPASGLIAGSTLPGSGQAPPSADRAGVLFCHWFEPGAPDSDRGQFLDEAAALARDGAICLLPQGRLPWLVEPSGAEADVAAIKAEVQGLRDGLDLLVARGADERRLAVVGHDFGGMTAALLADLDRRPRAYVLVAATPRWGDWFLPFWPIPDDRIDYLRALRPLDPIEHVGRAAPARLLFQFARSDYFIAPMTGRELFAAASEPKEMRPYEADHALRLDEARADREAFLREALGLASPG